VNIIKNVIAITGTPGTGKSSIARLLAKKIGARLVDIGFLIQNERLTAGFDERRDTLIADMKRIRKRITEIVKESEEKIIVEGHFVPHILPKNWIKTIFVLRRDPEELKEILERRQYKEEKVRENVAAEVLDVCLFDAIKICGQDKVCEIDITGKYARDIVEVIVAVLYNKEKCGKERIDWLEKLEYDGKIDDYLKYIESS